MHTFSSSFTLSLLYGRAFCLSHSPVSSYFLMLIFFISLRGYNTIETQRCFSSLNSILSEPSVFLSFRLTKEIDLLSRTTTKLTVVFCLHFPPRKYLFIFCCPSATSPSVVRNPASKHRKDSHSPLLASLCCSW
ncbi:MAG: hypothetical protein J3R72DRAFT_211407 [Linnemannia gamsii]|nr:MAG: hypothetical protein J3R72DRAFT_211407 [Linnemannia gamsii]